MFDLDRSTGFGQDFGPATIYPRPVTLADLIISTTGKIILDWQKHSRPVKKLLTSEKEFSNKSRKININSQRVDLHLV